MNDKSPQIELPDELVEIVERIRTRPVLQHSVDRSLTRAVQLAGPTVQAPASCDAKAAGSRAVLRSRAVRCAAPLGVAAAVVVLVLMLLRTPPTLAQSLSASNLQPWLFGKVTYALDGNEYRYVFWFSAAKRILALRFDGRCVLVRFEESLQQNSVQTFDTRSGAITNETNIQLREQDVLLFNALLAKEPLSAFAEITADAPVQPGVDTYRVRLSGDESRAEHVINISRLTGLLDSWQVSQPDGMKTTLRFQYPQSGPESIDVLRTLREP